MINEISKCTSVELKDYLKKLGFRYIWVDVDVKGMTFWLFEKTDEFKKALYNWNKVK